MLRVNSLIKEENWNINLLLSIHDELLFEVNDSLDLDLVIRSLINVMEDKITFNTPILVSTKVGKCWGDMHDCKKM